MFLDNVKVPVENRVGDLWSIMHFLNPGFLGSRDTFRSQFAVPIERDIDLGEFFFGLGDERVSIGGRALARGCGLRRPAAGRQLWRRSSGT